MKLYLTFKEKPFQFNGSWRSSFQTNRVYLCKEAENYKQTIEILAKNQLKKFFKESRQFPKGGFWTVDFKFYNPKTITAKGQVSKTKGDIDGGVKLTQDAIFSVMQADDALILASKQIQIPSKEWKTTVYLSWYPMEVMEGILEKRAEEFT